MPADDYNFLSQDTVKSPWDYANQMVNVQRNNLALQDEQAKQEWGNVLARNTDASGVPNYAAARAEAARNPVAARGMMSGLQGSGGLITQQQQQAGTHLDLIARGSADLMMDPSDANVAAVRQRLVAAGLPQAEIDKEISYISSLDPKGRQAYAYQHQLGAIDAQHRLEQRYGTPTQLQTGGAIQGATQSPQTGAIAPAGAAVPMTLTPGEGEQRIPTIDNNQYLPDGRTPNPNYGQPITVPLRTQVPGAQGRPAAPPQAGQPSAAPVAAPGATAPQGGAPGAPQRESYVLGPDGKPQKVLVPTQPAPAPGGALPTALPPGADITIKAANDAWATANTNANSYAQRSFPVAQALALAKSGTLTTGAGASAINDIKSWLQTRAATFGVDAQTIANSNFQQLEKYLQQNVNAQPMASGSDARLASALTGNPSAHLNTLALVDVLKATQALQRMEQMAVLDFRARGEPNGQWNRFMSDWQTHHDPRAFVFDQMDADQQRKMVMGMTGPERASFQRSLDLIKQHPEILNTAAMPH